MRTQRSIRLALAGAALLVAGCSALSPGETQPLAIHLQGGYEADDVEVWVDDDVVFRSRITTNNVLGLAQEVEIERKEGRHIVTVRVNGETTGTRSILLRAPLFVGISYNEAEDRILFVVSEEGFVYF
ncbi:MAG: hypothetical protein R2834_21730 [Rhodothermales bacterium]